MSSDRLASKVAIVTGAARGIGKAIAQRLADFGATVILGDISESVVKVAEDLSPNGKNYGIQVDVKDFASCARFYELALKKTGAERIDILVNNAGINRDSLFVNMTPEQWDEVIKVDLYSMFNVTKQVVEGMKRHNYGRIVNVSSMSWYGNVGQTNYSAAKAGVIGFTKSLAKELARYNVTVNAICPGIIDTPMTQAIPEKIKQKFLDRIPAGRVGKPEDVAGVVALMVSEDFSYVTGEIINISGGMTM
ncbi:MAG: beta-ketoacyl-ACP reductase [Nitrososphaerales archaeon]